MVLVCCAVLSVVFMFAIISLCVCVRERERERERERDIEREREEREKERDGSFCLIALNCHSKVSYQSVSLSHGAMGLSAVCYCSITWSYLFFPCDFFLKFNL